MSNDLTVGHTEFTPYDKNFDVDVYLNDLNKKMKESDVDELMADVTLIYNKFGVINGVFNRYNESRGYIACPYEKFKSY